MTVAAPWSYLTTEQLDALRAQVLPWLQTAITVRRRITMVHTTGITSLAWVEQAATALIAPRRAINDPQRRNEQETFNVDVWFYIAHPVTAELGDRIVHDGVEYVVVFVREPNPLFQQVGATRG